MCIYFLICILIPRINKVNKKTISLLEHRHADVLRRGFLWKVNEDVISLFSFAEAYFLPSTKKLQNKILSKNIVDALIKNCAVLELFVEVRRSSPHNIKKEIAFNLLEDCLTRCISCPHIFSKSERAKQNQDRSEHA